tara:strand:+ start:448 stop:732 length:285 start_codon:yes stop_codon:yes gene_type:complete
MTVTRPDLDRIHEKLDDTNKVLGALTVTVAKIATTMEERPRPCLEYTQLRRDHDRHVEAHTAVKRTWQQSVIKAVVDVVKVAVVGLVCFWIGAN